MNDNGSRVRPTEIKWMDPDDENDLLEFYKRNLDEYDRFVCYWNWRKENLQFSVAEKGIMAVHATKKIVGCVGLVPVNIWLSDKAVNAFWQQDSLVSSYVRGQGIGKKLVEKAHDGCDMALAKGTSTTMYGLRKAIGYKDVPRSNYMIRVCRPKGIQGSIIKKILLNVLGLWSKLFISPKINKKITVQQFNEFDDSFDDLDAALIDANTLRPRKGKEYLNWRYTRCPGKQYTLFKAGLGNARGAIVVNCTGAESDEGWVVDMICNNKDRDCAYALIQAAISYFNDNQVSRVWCFATHPNARKWFYRFGFSPTNQSPRFTYHAVDRKWQEKLSSCCWDFWHGDGDIELYT